MDAPHLHMFKNPVVSETSFPIYTEMW